MSSDSPSAAVAVDHLVVAAATLEQGVAWCEDTLGITPGPGGKHPLMGTHNRLFSIAGAGYPQAYLEIIAIDPEAPPPGRARWFALDDAALQARIAQQPRLIHFAARSDMLDMHRWGLITVGCPPGDPVSASRQTPRGLLEWQILLRADGALQAGGALPTLIHWPGIHPVDAMPDSGVQLTGLALRGVPARARDVLRMRGAAFPTDEGPALVATLRAPRGEIILEST